ncbi:MAG: hypothetical protein ACTSXJ_01820 [Candidatus Baldrarchaeia archaeon]
MRIAKRRASPIVEEGLLIGLSLIALALLIQLIMKVIDWSGSSLDQVLNNLSSIFG